MQIKSIMQVNVYGSIWAWLYQYNIMPYVKWVCVEIFYVAWTDLNHWATHCIFEEEGDTDDLGICSAQRSMPATLDSAECCAELGKHEKIQYRDVLWEPSSMPLCNLLYDIQSLAENAGICWDAFLSRRP